MAVCSRSLREITYWPSLSLIKSAAKAIKICDRAQFRSTLIHLEKVKVTMKKLVQVVFSLVLLVSINGYAQTKEQSEKIAGVAKKLATLNARLGPDVREVQMNWKDNSEVKTVLSYSTLKRIAAINVIVSNLQDNEAKIFPQPDKNKSQLAGIIISRIFSYSYLRELTTDSDDDIAVRDYLDGELSDLKLTINHYCPVKNRTRSVGCEGEHYRFGSHRPARRMRAGFSRITRPTRSVDKCTKRYRVEAPSWR